jgi:predicted naringenin-chalcone synthase
MRHSAIDDFRTGDGELFRTLPGGLASSPATGERNRVYAREAKTLAVDVARRALDGVPDLDLSAVTHLVFASCTGFANPGPDYHIIRELGLREDVQRYTVGFMGCYAAFPALRMAAQFCTADPSAVVLVVCLELCTLHMQSEPTPENIVSNSLFADGAAAAVVSARTPALDRAHFRLGAFRSALVAGSEEHMAWDIGDHGFKMVLSAYVPGLIGANIRGIVGDLLAPTGLGLADIGAWAVHPGGRAILDQVERQVGLGPDALTVSRGVLRDYGNMSSPTVLFVLERMLSDPASGDAATCALAFGPGLTVESAILERVGATSSVARPSQASLSR